MGFVSEDSKMLTTNMSIASGLGLPKGAIERLCGSETHPSLPGHMSHIKVRLRFWDRHEPRRSSEVTYSWHHPTSSEAAF